MKLIDILVNKESEGWTWPENAIKCLQDHDCEVRFFDHKGFNHSMSFVATILSDKYRHIGVSSEDLSHDYFVTREQYEAALAASKVPVWSGEGLPSVGCVIQVATPIYNHGDKARVICHDEGAAICRYVDGDRLGSLCQLEAHECTPIRTEAERKREAVTQALSKVLLSAYSDDSDDSSTENHIYNAISAGKIPGVKLED